MDKRRGMKLNNKGASLIAVLIAIVVVGVMGSVVMQLTITNLQMKEVERQGKKNFYSAEEFMGYLTNQINAKCAKQLQEAFNDMLARYKSASESGDGLKVVFSKAYLERLISTFGVADPTPSQKKNGTEIVYEVGHFSLSAVTNLIYSPDGSIVPDIVPDDLKDTAKYGFAFTPVTGKDYSLDNFYYADYEKGTFTLGNVCVFAKDSFGNETKIQADLVFHTPDINLEGNNVVKEFMRYSLIADDKIDIFAQGVNVDGNVYAGEDGILCNNNAYASFIGKKIITRGDIACISATEKFQVGRPDNSSYSQIWAKNYKTLSTGTGAKLYISGDSYISDDISVDGDNSEVVITGAYYGYNFQENYGSPSSPTDSAYSSAIMINGKNAMVDMYDLTSLMVYGRTFIGRDKDAPSFSNDILMGEGISVKSNQIAYYVPSNCVKDDGTLDYVAYENYSGVENIDTYVTGTGVTEYHYMQAVGATNVEKTAYYLKFADDQAANDFYYAYFNGKSAVMMDRARRYINSGVRDSLSDHYSLRIRTENNVVMRGDYIFSDAAGNLVTAKWNIPGGYWGMGQTYFEFAKDHAIRYKSLVTTLEDKVDSSMASDVRTLSTKLFDELIDHDNWDGFFTAHASELTDGKFEKPWKEHESDPDTGIILAIVNNEGGAPYVVTAAAGLVIASGDVNVEQNFKGTIISGGVIHLNHPISIASDEVLISKMVSKDAMLKSNALFAKLFKGYSETADDVINGSSIEKYMTYDNWTKTME